MASKKGTAGPDDPAKAPINPDPPMPGRGFTFTGPLEDEVRSQFLHRLLWLKLDLASIHRLPTGASRFTVRLAADAPFEDTQAYFSILAALKRLGNIEEI